MRPCSPVLKVDHGEAALRSRFLERGAKASRVWLGRTDAVPWPQVWSRCEHCALETRKDGRLRALLFDPWGDLNTTLRTQPLLSSTRWRGFFHDQPEEVRHGWRETGILKRPQGAVRLNESSGVGSVGRVVGKSKGRSVVRRLGWDDRRVVKKRGKLLASGQARGHKAQGNELQSDRVATSCCIEDKTVLST